MRKLFVALLLTLSLPAFSQLRELRFKRLTVEDGLPENFATCHLQDKYGYHWFGTQNGLARYDGYKIKMYPLKNTSEQKLVYSSIKALAEDKNGNIWIASYLEGMFCLNPRTGKCIQYKLPDAADNVGAEYRLVIDREGMIWGGFVTAAGRSRVDRLDPQTGKFTCYDSTRKDGTFINSTVINWSIISSDGILWGSGNRGLYRFDYTSKKFVTIIQNEVGYIYEAPSQPGILWFSQKEGNKYVLTKYDTKTGAMEMFRHDPASPGSIHSDTVNKILETSTGDLWLSTTNGISLFNRSAKSFKSYIPPTLSPGDNSSNICDDIWEGKNGQLWINTRGSGLFYLSSPTAALYRFVYDENKTNGLPNNAITFGSFVDDDRNLWLFTRGEGINKLDEKASQFDYVQHYNDKSKYPGGSLRTIVDLNNGEALVLTSNALLRYNKKDSLYTPVAMPVEAVNTTYYNMSVDRTGIAWISTGNGLFSYNVKAGKFQRYFNIPGDSSSIANNFVWYTLEDRAGNFWVGTRGGGLNKLDRATGKFTRYPFVVDQQGLEKGTLDDDDVTIIYEDRKGTLWVGTNNGGLNRFDPVSGKFKSYFNRDNGFQCIISILEDSKGRFWVGTYLWGLFLFDRETGTTKRWSEKEGLAFDQVYGIKEDGNGRIWVCSNRGFSILDGTDFSISYLNAANGLPSNIISNRAIFEMDNDWIIPTKGGMIRFNPAMLIKSSVAPKTVIESVSFNRNTGDSTVDLHDINKLSLSYNENRLQFQFVGLHFSNSALNQYQYKLEGYDRDWIKAGTQRSAVYTNLSPGTYRFMVKAANSDGIWSEPVSVEFIIHPPWWKTWWAYTLYVLASIVALSSFIAYRSRRLRRQNKVLEERVEHRTAQLKQSINDLKSTQQQLVQSEKMASLGELTAGIAHEIQNPLNFINNFSEVSSEMLEEMKEEMDAGNNEEVKAIANDINKNLEKIVYHGKRADSIVKNMLQHSRQSTGQKEPTDINALVDEYLRLSYHGLRAKDKSFNAIMETHYDPAIGKVPAVAQDMGRVLLNLFNNAFYSVMQKRKQQANGFQPTLYVTTQKTGGTIVIKVKDNGTGIPQKVLDKIYQPFFTTKPTGEGTGLGLSLSYDIIKKGHAGDMKVESKEGDGAEFSIILPYQN